MQSILHSAFFQALGYAIANSLWQAALLWLIATIINNIGHPSASKKYTVSLVAQVTSFVWFLFTLHFYYDKSAEALMQVKLNESLNGGLLYEPTADSFTSGISYLMIKAEQLLPYLSLAYLAMLTFLSIRFTRAFIYTSQIRYKGLHKADIDLRLFVKRTAGILGIKKEVLIYYSELVKGPLTIGFLKPLILLPVASINNLSPDQVEAILLHELAHIRRFDYLVNILQVIIEITLFFNPFVQLLGKEIKKERENSCDDWVLQFQYNPAMYAEALLQVAILQAKPAFAMNATTQKNELLPRVKRMLNKQEKNNRYRNQVFSLILITLMLSTVAWLHPSANKTTQQQNNIATKKIRVEPLAANIDNPFFNPAYFFTKSFENKIGNDISLAIKEKINKSTSAAEKATAIAETITPLALETLNNAYDEFTASLEQATNSLPVTPEEKVNIHENAVVTVPDIKVNTDELLKAELAKVDWHEMGNEVKEVVSGLSEEKGLSLLTAVLGKDKMKAAVEKVTGELNKITGQQAEYLKTQNVFLKNFDFKFLEEKKIAESEKADTKHIQRGQKQINNRRNKIAIADVDTIAINRAIKNAYGSVNSQIAYKTYSDITNYYTPAVYNDAYTYSYTDHYNDLDSALIVIRHDKANDSCHVKKIVVQIIGNNGCAKVYELTAEVYQ